MTDTPNHHADTDAVSKDFIKIHSGLWPEPSLLAGPDYNVADSADPDPFEFKLHGTLGDSETFGVTVWFGDMPEPLRIGCAEFFRLRETGKICRTFQGPGYCRIELSPERFAVQWKDGRTRTTYDLTSPLAVLTLRRVLATAAFFGGGDFSVAQVRAIRDQILDRYQPYQVFPPWECVAASRIKSVMVSRSSRR